MPPIPPRRSLRDLLIPRDATETARQGKGIGDVEAMRQMATMAVPELLRNAPVTSTPMGAFDTARALADRDYTGAGMAALGMVPFAGAIKYADEVADVVKSAMRGAKELPMDTPSRMARAAEQGFTHDAYHGTGFSGDMAELRPSSRGSVGPGAYLTKNPESASNYAVSTAEYMATRGEPYAPNVMPVLASVKNPLRIKNSEEYWDVVNKLLPNRRPGIGLKKPQAEEIADAAEITSALKKAGYDGVLLGDEVVVPLESSQVRSKFAAFDPANVGKAGLMGALAGTLGLSAAGRNNPATKRKKD